MQDGPLKKFIEDAKHLNAEEAGKLLESSDIAKVHDEIAEEGQTKVVLFIFNPKLFLSDTFNNFSNSRV